MNNRKNNSRTNSNNTFFSIIILFIILALIFVLIYFVSKNINNPDINGMKEYKVLDTGDAKLPLKGNGKNMNNCLPGCIRGVCNKRKNGSEGRVGGGNNCKYDFQCQYCQDVKTNMFYVNFDNEREIVPLYEEEKEHKLPLKQKDLLNDEIKKNNEYIHKLNDRIKHIESFL